MNKLYHYAQLDEDNVCIAVTSHPNPLDMENAIELEFRDESLLLKQYAEGEWKEWEREETPIEKEPSNAEIYENQIIIMEALADLYAGGAN